MGVEPSYPKSQRCRAHIDGETQDETCRKLKFAPGIVVDTSR
jgi:hypothetical protein